MPLTRFSAESLPAIRSFAERAVSPAFAKRMAAAMHTKLVLGLDSATFSALYDDVADATCVDDLQYEHRQILRRALEEIDTKVWTQQQESQHPRNRGRFAAKPGDEGTAGAAGGGETGTGIEFHLENVVANAKRNDAIISPIVKDAVKTSGGRLEEFQARLQTPDELASKVQRVVAKMPGANEDSAASAITDALRYAAVIPTGDHASGVKATIAALEQKGYHPFKVKNHWQTGDAYNGINAQFVNPQTGFKFEMQFHTDESWQRKAQVALLVDHFRDGKDGKERKMLWDQMVKASDGVTQPQGILEIGVLAQPAAATPKTKLPKAPTSAAPLASAANSA